MNKKNLQNQSGFTLVEVLLSITLLGIVLISFLGLFNQAYSYTNKNENKTVGINVARNVLYYFEQQDYTDIEKQYLADLSSDSIDLTSNNCQDPVFDTEVCKGFFTTTINNTEFTTEKVTLQKHAELDYYLIPITITVTWADESNKQTVSVEGAIKR